MSSESLQELYRDFNTQSIYMDKVLLDDLCEVRMRMGILLQVVQVVDLVYRDTVQATVAGGGLHPITKEVMKYILNICHYNLNSYQPFQIVRRYRIIPDRERKSSFSEKIAKMIIWKPSPETTLALHWAIFLWWII